MLIEVRGATCEEMESVLNLLPQVMNSHREYFLALYRNHPNSLPEHSRIVKINGKIVSHLRIFDQSVRVGGVMTRVGAIADVMTLPEYRGQGYMRKCLGDAFCYMKENGYDYSTILSGVKVYDRCGWERLNTNFYNWPIQDVPLNISDENYLRRFEFEDIKAVKEVYDGYCQERSATHLRNLDYWRRHFNWIEDSMAGFFVATFNEKVVGYIRTSIHNESLQVHEACFLPGHVQVNWSLLDIVIRYAKKIDINQLTLHLPTDHPWVGYLSEKGLITKTSQTLLVRMVNLIGLLNKLKVQWEKKANLFVEGFALQISCMEQQASLIIKNNKVRVLEEFKELGCKTVKLNQNELFSVLLNYKLPSELDWGSRFNLSNKEVYLLDNLFDGPKPIYWKTDGV
jgi:predicted acetyltransferase